MARRKQNIYTRLDRMYEGMQKKREEREEREIDAYVKSLSDEELTLKVREWALEDVKRFGKEATVQQLGNRLSWVLDDDWQEKMKQGW